MPAKNKILFTDKVETRPLMKQLFIKNFDKSLLKPKQGFSGLSNESMRKVINSYKNTIELLEIKDFENLFKNNLALEWKLLNVEYFLKNFLKL